MNSMTDFVNESYTHYQDMKAKEAAAAQMKADKTMVAEKEEVKDV